MNLRTASDAGVRGSPTSDYVDEGSCCSTGELPASDSSGCSSSGHSPASPRSAVTGAVSTAPGTGHGTPKVAAPFTSVTAIMETNAKKPQHPPYDPLVHTTSKPPYSFSCLIFMAIEDSPGHALPVKEIYAWILNHFPYFKNAPTGWKNSVRHNLSLNKCFRKVEKAPQNLGKGSLWMVDPLYRPNLVQALAKSPLHQFATTLGRTDPVNSSSPNSGSEPKVPLSPGHCGAQQTPPSASGSGNSGVGSSGSSTSSSNGTGTTVTNNSNSNSSTSSSNSAGINSNVPDPTLFPFLSRRLALTTPRQPGSPKHTRQSAQDDGPKSTRQSVRDENLDDVDAAAAMLALKHAHLHIPRKDDWYKRLQEETSEAMGLRKRMRVSSKPGQTEERMVITTSPSEDHTYSAALNLSARSSAAAATAVSTVPVTSHGTHAPPSTTSSPDEAFEEGSDSDDGTEEKLYRSRRTPIDDIARSPAATHRILYDCDRGDTSDEERRKIAEGADALLNLAGIRTDGGAVSLSSSLVALNPTLPPESSTPAPQTAQLSTVYSTPRSRRRKKPPPPSSRAVATQKHHHHRSASEKRGSSSSATARR